MTCLSDIFLNVCYICHINIKYIFAQASACISHRFIGLSDWKLYICSRISVSSACQSHTHFSLFFVPRKGIDIRQRRGWSELPRKRSGDRLFVCSIRWQLSMCIDCYRCVEVGFSFYQSVLMRLLYFL